MKKLSRKDLYSLEDYALRRSTFRRRILSHKQSRQLAIGEHVTLYFEDRLTIQYQIQEMLRVERIFESQAIEEELATYNPLIPDGGNLKATLMIEYVDVDERRQALARLKGIENAVWLCVDGYDKVFALADEDLDRSTDEKTSAVHFLRFEFSPDSIAALKEGARLSAGIDHQAYQYSVNPVADAVRAALVKDFD